MYCLKMSRIFLNKKWECESHFYLPYPRLGIAHLEDTVAQTTFGFGSTPYTGIIRLYS